MTVMSMRMLLAIVRVRATVEIESHTTSCYLYKKRHTHNSTPICAWAIVRTAYETLFLT